jgi:hypothetical protein
MLNVQQRKPVKRSRTARIIRASHSRLAALDAALNTDAGAYAIAMRREKVCSLHMFHYDRGDAPPARAICLGSS